MRIEWHERAACAGVPSKVFFPERGQRERDVYERARAICEDCPVIWECLDQALRTEQQSFRVGMFGGMSPDQRDRWAKFNRSLKKLAVA